MAAIQMTGRDPLRAIRTLPNTPLIDVSTIKGNTTRAQRQLCANAFAEFFLTEGTHGCSVSRRLRWLESHIRKGEKGVWAELVAEIEVGKDMVNVHGTLAGPCAIHILDLWSVNAICQLGVALDIDTTGVSQTLNVVFHQPAYPGQTLRVLAKTLAADGMIGVGACEIYEKETGKLVASCVQTNVNPTRVRGKM